MTRYSLSHIPMTDVKEKGEMPETPFTEPNQIEKQLHQSIDVLAQFGFTDNLSYNREILRRDTFSVTMPKLNLLVNNEYDLHKILGQHVLFVQKALGLNPLYWTLQDAMWLLKKLPKPIKTDVPMPPPLLPNSADSDVRVQDIDQAYLDKGGASARPIENKVSSKL